MGLDGISINQLRTPENNSAELNSKVKFSLNQEHKTVDGLSQGQKVDPDKDREKNDAKLAKQFSADEDIQEESQDETQEEIIKYDLSYNSRYILKVNDESNSILIIEKQTNLVVSQIDADELSQYVSFLSNSQGSMINRKF